jgi:iron complex outermembrane receptor protein
MIQHSRKDAKYRTPKAFAVLFATNALLGSTVNAQTPDEAMPPVLEEVYVTAQKRVEELGKIPMSLSVFSQQAMEELGTTRLTGTVSLVPNMANGTGGLTIRGIGTTSIRSTAPTVPIHVDGIYTDSDPRGLGSNLDLERVEVLRGPQGTLFGRNATAGAINMITNKPIEEFEAYGDFAYETGDSATTRLVVNAPVSETLFTRLAAEYINSDGTLHNPEPGQVNGAASDNVLSRFSVKWVPQEKMLWDVNLEYLQNKGVDGTFQQDYYVSKPDAETAIVYPTGLPDDEVPPYGPRANEFGSFKHRNLANTQILTLRSILSYEFSDAWSLTWLAGLEDVRGKGNSHSLPLATAMHNSSGQNAEEKRDVMSHELDLNYEADWGTAIAGLYFYEKNYRDNNVNNIWRVSGSSGPASPPVLETAIDISNLVLEHNEDTSEAAFSQLTYNLTEATRLTGGVRYSLDNTHLGNAQTTYCLFGDFSSPYDAPSALCQALSDAGAFDGIFGPSALPSTQEQWDNVSWKAVVDHDISADLLSYATVSTGYKQGAILERGDNGITGVKPETNINYETGLRSKFLDDSASLNFTLFWMEYEDLQVSTSQIINGVPTVGFTNAGQARSRGVEVEGLWQITPNDQIGGYITYLDAEITEWPNAPDTFRGQAFTFDAKGQKLPNSPEMTFRVSYSHSFDLGDWGELLPTISTFWSDKSWIGVTNGPQDLNKDYWRSDFFLRYQTVEENVWVDAYANNIEDHRYKTTYLNLLTEAENGNPGGGMQWAGYTAGRVLGLRVGYRF